MKPPLPIALAALILAAGVALNAAEKKPAEVKPVTLDEFVSLFNGEDLTGWDGDKELWSVEDGAITGTTTDEEPIPYNKFLIWRDGELDDFELKVEYRITSGNSGVQYRSFPIDTDPKSGEPVEHVVGGYQADIDSTPKFTGINYGEKFRGILAKRGEKTEIGEDGKPTVVEQFGDAGELQKNIKEADWNEYHIIARGHHLVHKINGVVMSEVTDNDDEARRTGLLAFQVHRGPAMKVQFRKIQLKRLPLEDRKKVVFVAGLPSHAPGDHEHNAGCALLSEYLNEFAGDQIVSTVYHNGWPSDPSAFQNADALVIYSDGGQRHPGFFHRRQIDYLARHGVGIGCIHYAVEMVPGDPNRDLTRWIGGAFEVDWSVNPHWDAEFAKLPDHPVSNGVKPFIINDEWYFNMRFAEGLKDVTPILSAVAPDSTMDRPDGHHSGNPDVRKMVAAKQPQHVVWTYHREDGGRGFGFTGGHYHKNWQHDEFRKTGLNAIAWIAGAQIPESGIETPTPDDERMAENLDPKTPRKPKGPKKQPKKTPKKAA